MLQHANNLDYSLVSKNLSLSFGANKALDQLNIEIPLTGVTALLGPNGAGKTSLINCALGLIKAQKGHLTILGETPGSKNIKRKLGVMLQDTQLPDLLTPKEHLELFASYFDNAAAIDQTIERCQLGEFVNRKYKDLSGGQKRLVQFAVALIGEPKFLFLDEPTTGLNIDARRFLWQTVRELSENGTTILLTTHYLEEADMLSDHVVLISKGKVAATGSSSDIRNLVSGSLISCHTRLTMKELQALVGVNKVRKVGRLTEISSNDVNHTLGALLKLDTHLKDLSVSAPSLEDAFLQIRKDS